MKDILLNTDTAHRFSISDTYHFIISHLPCLGVKRGKLFWEIGCQTEGGLQHSNKNNMTMGKLKEKSAVSVAARFNYQRGSCHHIVHKYV